MDFLADETLGVEIGSYMTGRELQRASLGNQTWRDQCLRPQIWRRVAPRELGMAEAPGIHHSTPALLEKGEAGDQRRAWLSWQRWRHRRSIPRDSMATLVPMRVRAGRAWARLEAWMREHAPACAETLCEPVEPEAWTIFVQHVREELRIHEHSIGDLQNQLEPLRMIYEVHGGQDATSIQENFACGIFGGFSAYNTMNCCALLPLHVLHQLYSALQLDHPGTIVPFAMSMSQRLFRVLDLETGNVVTRDGPRLRCLHPNTENHDGLLLWFEEYTRRLENGIYVAGAILPDMPEMTSGVVLFPCKPTLTSPSDGALQDVSRAVTRGIEVVASSLYLGASGWSYSIRIQLLPPSHPDGLTEEERGFATCQLHRRHWEVRSPNGQVDHVNGAGVIGKYPIFFEGGFQDCEQERYGNALVMLQRRSGVFVYQSMSGGVMPGSSFGGELMMVPGDLQHPTGPAFDVTVGRFVLLIPEFEF